MNNRTLWQPVPVETPVVDREFLEMNPLQRSVESWCFTFLCFEFWVSNDGHLREWIRHCLRWAAVLAIPTVFIAPVIGVILNTLLSWTTTLTAIAHHLVMLPILAVMAIVAIGVAWEVLKVLISSR